MAKSKFTPEARAVIVAQIRAGLPLASVCRDLGIRLKTAEGWLTRGRREEEGQYADFAIAVEEARAAHERAGLTAEEYEKHLAKAVRGGSVQAMKLWWDIHGRDSDDKDREPESPFDQLDEIAERRKQRGA